MCNLNRYYFVPWAQPRRFNSCVRLSIFYLFLFILIWWNQVCKFWASTKWCTTLSSAIFCWTISWFICNSIKVRFQRNGKNNSIFLLLEQHFLQCCWFFQFCTHDRSKHEICQTESFSKLWSTFPQTIFQGSPRPCRQVNSAYSCYC